MNFPAKMGQLLRKERSNLYLFILVNKGIRRLTMALRLTAMTLLAGVLSFGSLPGLGAEKVFRAGAAAVDITPRSFPRIISGGFLAAKADRANDPLFARCLVLDDGTTRVAIVVVDTLMMPRSLIDEAKERASKATGIPTDKMMVSATHTHSAPSVMGALGTPVDEDYAKLLPEWIAESIEVASKKLVPAEIAWGARNIPDLTHCRRWIKRPDRIGTDPFGNQTVRAMMHPGYQNPDYIGPAGPVDPELFVLFVVKNPFEIGKPFIPIAFFCNFSMHYFGAAPVSADYFGRFCRMLFHKEKVDLNLLPITIMSQGTAGDLHWMDYSKPSRSITMNDYARELILGVEKFSFRGCVDSGKPITLAMAEKKITLRRRVPDENRLAWAQKVIEAMKGRKTPVNIPEVYALEQFYLRDHPQCELKLQALRIGDVGITAIPCEVFGITGLKLKTLSPLRKMTFSGTMTFNIELANGAEGYIPPPEQHKLGGYTTWPARTAGLEVQAEPIIVENVLQLLEKVSGKPRRSPKAPYSSTADKTLATKPLAFWQLGEMAGPCAFDATENHNHAEYEDGIAFYLEARKESDPEGRIAQGEYIDRAAHFAGGRLKASLPKLGENYSVSFWFWNGLPQNARPVTGYLFSRGADKDPKAKGDHLGIGGTHGNPGKLFFFNGNVLNETLAGTTTIPLKTWTYVLLVRRGSKVEVYLNHQKKPEISGTVRPGFAPGVGQVFIGGRCDGFASFEGKICEVAVYDRAVDP
jgi:hypothetical protein